MSDLFISFCKITEISFVPNFLWSSASENCGDNILFCRWEINWMNMPKISIYLVFVVYNAYNVSSVTAYLYPQWPFLSLLLLLFIKLFTVSLITVRALFLVFCVICFQVKMISSMWLNIMAFHIQGRCVLTAVLGRGFLDSLCVH